MISLVLDNPSIFRVILGTLISVLFYTFSIGNICMRFFVSKFFWNLYPHWSRITNLPLVMKFMGAKMILSFGVEKYLVVEKIVAKFLTEIESKMIEDRLPITEI
jgi:hypothetical protein